MEMLRYCAVGATHTHTHTTNLVILFFVNDKKKLILAGIFITKTGNYSTCFLKEGKKKKIFNQ
jgi:hypothetical protein